MTRVARYWYRRGKRRAREEILMMAGFIGIILAVKVLVEASQ